MQTPAIDNLILKRNFNSETLTLLGQNTQSIDFVAGEYWI
jgi:hypothetical protein